MAEELRGGATPTHADVDHVLSQVTNVHDLPVAERVAVFERVHDELRRSLAADQAAGDTSSDTAGA